MGRLVVVRRPVCGGAAAAAGGFRNPRSASKALAQFHCERAWLDPADPGLQRSRGRGLGAGRPSQSGPPGR